MNTEPTITYNEQGMTLTTDKTTSKVGSINTLFNYIGEPPYWPDWTYRPTYYPATLTTTVVRESKTDTAFKVVEKLMEKGHIKELSVKEFMALVKEIAATL